MKNKKIFLDFDDEDSVLVGLIKLKQEMPYHELFFGINNLNQFNFVRKKDLEIRDFLGVYYFPQFETYDEVSQSTFIIFANKLCDFRKIEGANLSLFDTIGEEKFFVNKEIDFILFSKEGWEDFSGINLPESVSSVEEYCVEPEEELYEIITNYDE